MTHTLAEAAFKLAGYGFKIFPCKPRDKVPAVKWKDLATSDPDTVHGWWQGGPALNIGLVTGRPSGVFVLDIDGDDGVRRVVWAVPSCASIRTSTSVMVAARPVI